MAKSYVGKCYLFISAVLLCPIPNLKTPKNTDLFTLSGKTVESKELWKEFIGRKAGGVNKIRKRDSLNVSFSKYFAFEKEKPRS